ncbi:hypothetical protein [Guillardia theta]|uniref:Vitamin K epoxide reductase domain-containing protein n=1 Tax=Guillardia theta TaxID=55529 RepID=Q9AW34_GUITH|nr:hypothetical protein GTHECHR2156 [Guillardia theta]CAC27037.1 hypothetical protein [Guillardia theta]|mmetsp:Transcript_9081/g.30272  ORF Transcript_9081/g.30272 Transcript_9081/m.30272 type:complete len:228 (+) Transcript_9081:1416-2099(+)
MNLFINNLSKKLNFRKNNRDICLLNLKKFNITDNEKILKKFNYKLIFFKYKRHSEFLEAEKNVFIIILSLIGILETSYLTFYKYTNSEIYCSSLSCSKVLSSTFSEIMGIPLSLIGFFFYLIIFFKNTKIKNIFNISDYHSFYLDYFFVLYNTMAIYFSLILEIFIKNDCLYCFLSILNLSIIQLLKGLMDSGNLNENYKKNNLIYLIIFQFFLIFIFHKLNIIEIF